MEAVSANLNWFLQPIGQNLTKPQKKFLRDGLVGLLRAGRPVVCRMARKLAVKHWSLTTLREKLIKIGAKVVAHSRYAIFQMAEVAIPRGLFRAILERIRRLRPPETVPG